MANDEKINEYYNKLNSYMNYITNNQYIFELTKCCGYSEFLPIFMNCKLSELYTNISYKLEIQKEVKLFAINTSTNEKLEIPNDNNVFIKNFLKLYKNYFTPVYPVPAKVVYKIYYYSGCCHDSNHSTNHLIASECIIHKQI
jgi:hypothetical protein